MKKNKKIKTGSKGKLFQILIGIVLIAFILLLLSKLFTGNNGTNTPLKSAVEGDVYKFTKHGELTFQSKEGKFISSIDIELADNEERRAQGLMYRTEMKENQGMLFVFPYEEMQSFWMKNTVLSLDMIFINSKLEIVTIHKNTQPYATTSYPSTKPSQYVLETLAGYTDKHNIKVGDKVVFRRTH